MGAGALRALALVADMLIAPVYTLAHTPLWRADYLGEGIELIKLG